MATKRLTPEEELEKQYRDYKSQFEQWKEKNKNSVGTEAYIAYVEQFQAWERDVDKRREMIRAKAEAEAEKAKAQAYAAAELKRKKEQESIEEQQRKQQLEVEAVAQAVAYAKHQQSYLAHHQAAMQKEQEMRKVGSGILQQKEEEPINASQMAETMKQMAQLAHVMMNDQTDQLSNNAVRYQHPSASASAQAHHSNPAPQLWGSDRIQYDSNDPMYKKWHLRAAPPYYKPAYRPPPPTYQAPPCWLFAEQMKEAKLMMAPMNLPPLALPKFPS